MRASVPKEAIQIYQDEIKRLNSDKSNTHVRNFSAKVPCHSKQKASTGYDGFETNLQTLQSSFNVSRP